MSDPNTDRPTARVPIRQVDPPTGASDLGEPSDAAEPASRPAAEFDAGAEEEQREANRQNAERLAESRARADQLEADRAEADRAEADRAEVDRAEIDRAENDRAEADGVDAERAGADRAEADRADRAEADRAARAEADRAARAEAEAEADRAEAAHAEADRAEAESDRAELARAAADHAEPQYAAPLSAAALSAEPDPIASRQEYNTLASDVAATRVQPEAHQPEALEPETVQPETTQPKPQPEPEPRHAEAVPTGETPAPASADQRTFVRPPLEPKRRGNRAIGSLIAVASVLVFAAVFVVIGSIIILIGVPDQQLGSVVLRFLGSPTFFVPAFFFVVGFVLLVLLLNRASWWTYIVGSLFVAALVYFGTIGIRLLADNIVIMTPDEASRRFASYAANPFVIAAAFAAREVAMWFGAIIAARGRRVKAANVTAREQHAVAAEQYRAEFERGYTPGV